jgi:hypothetical protein
MQLLLTTKRQFNIELSGSCQTIRNYPSILERIRRSMMRRVEASIGFHGGRFQNVL